MRKLEVIVLNEIDSVAAEQAGADRLELVSNMEVGGLSPAIETIKKVIAAVTIPVNVMVRFKAYDFVYNQTDMIQIFEYIDLIKGLGINGVVFGSLNEDGTINQQQMNDVKSRINNLDFTFHRAIDQVDEHYRTNFEIIDCVATTVLTSGGLEFPIVENIDLLKSVSTRNVRVLVGGGINKSNYQQLFNQLPNVDFHVGSLAYINGDFTNGIDQSMIIQLKSELN